MNWQMFYDMCSINVNLNVLTFEHNKRNKHKNLVTPDLPPMNLETLVVQSKMVAHIFNKSP